MARGRKTGSLLTFIDRKKRHKTSKYKVDRTQCRHCLYRPIQGFESNVFGCAYIFFTGKRRPSEPSPNCTAFKKYNRAEREKMVKEMKQKYNSGEMGF